MCISENRGGHHGRLAIPKKFKKRRLVAPERTESANACTDAHKPPQVVEHHYHDHIRDQKSSSFHEEDTVELEKAHFPIKLHAILDHIEEDGHAHVISWQPHGRSFKVHKQDIFMKEILPEYFKLQRYASFQRQLNLYGFQRITKGRDKGSYYHELMLRGRPFLAYRITRTRIKGTGVRPRANPDSEPDFYSMPAIDTDSPAPLPVDEEEEEVEEEVTAEDVMETEEDDTRKTPSPSPSVVDRRSPKEKLGQVFPNETVSSNVIPYETASSCASDTRKSDGGDDEVIIFEGKPFHYLDPFAVIQERGAAVAPPTLVPSYHHEYAEKEARCKQEQDDTSRKEQDARRQEEDTLFSIQEMDAMMERLNKPGGIWSIDVNAMDDKTFGTVLENLVVRGGECYI